MSVYYKPLNVSQIASSPHNIPDKVVEKLPTFQGNNAISATAHVMALSNCFFSWFKDVENQHDDV